MINKIKYKLVILLLALTASSCNKWLELKPRDGLVRDNFWETKEQLHSAVIGIYSSLLNPSLIEDMFAWGELRADMIRTTNYATRAEINVVNNEILPDNPIADWSGLYRTINYCNTVIEFGPQVADPTLTELDRNSYIAEARGIRALMYFYLLRVWGEVPLQLKPSSSDTQIEQLAKSSKEEVAAQILLDLDFAALYAKPVYGSDSRMNKGRLTQFGVNALQADVYLWLDRYEDVIKACEKVEKSGRYGLIKSSNQSAWFNMFFIGNSVESIFEVQFDSQAPNSWYNTLAIANRRFTASPLMGEEVYGLSDDPAEKDIRGDGASFRSSDLSVFKLVGEPGDRLVSSTNNSTRHWFFYRYADILMMKAEALAWTNRGQEALDIINEIRERANALEITVESPSPDSPDDLSDYILNERAREFAFEGKRWFDLLRVAKRNNYARKNIIIDAIGEIPAPEKQQLVISKLNDVRSHYLPISFTELQADKLLEQNPFYK